jgi:hypothetical protein
MMGVQVLELSVDFVHVAHAVHAAAPAAEYRFATQLPQLVAPEAAANLPATQLTHWVPPVVSL